MAKSALGNIEFKGFREFDKLLSQLPKSVERRVIRGALIASARPIVVAAKANLMPHKRTGKGAKTVKARSLKRGGRSGFSSRAVLVAVSATEDAFYLRYLENGRENQSPTPWLRPAVDNNMGEQRKILKNELRIRILKEATRLARKNGAKL